jgi:hypothetical protein
MRQNGPSRRATICPCGRPQAIHKAPIRGGHWGRCGVHIVASKTGHLPLIQRQNTLHIRREVGRKGLSQVGQRPLVRRARVATHTQTTPRHPQS